jgi:hypothetical protein
MSTDNLAALKSLLGDEPRPAVTVHRFDRREVKDALQKSHGTETGPKFRKAFNAKGTSATDKVKKRTSLKVNFEIIFCLRIVQLRWLIDSICII